MGWDYRGVGDGKKIIEALVVFLAGLDISPDAYSLDLNSSTKTASAN